jgi:hypothetical protein
MASWNKASKKADYDGKWQYDSYTHTSGDRGKDNKWREFQPSGQEDAASEWAWKESTEWGEVMKLPDTQPGTTLGDHGTSISKSSSSSGRTPKEAATRSAHSAWKSVTSGDRGSTYFTSARHAIIQSDGCTESRRSPRQDL